MRQKREQDKEKERQREAQRESKERGGSKKTQQNMKRFQRENTAEKDRL